MKRALLDSNVLLALFDSDHIDHDRARRWLSAEIRHGWASCAVRQNGFVRIISQPRYPSPIAPAQAVNRLRGAIDSKHHEFWPCDVSLVDERHVDTRRLLGPRQLTDVYLLALAVVKGGRFVTFDGSVPRDAVKGAEARHLVVL